jgi:hypothetical protein
MVLRKILAFKRRELGNESYCIAKNIMIYSIFSVAGIVKVVKARRL